MSVELVELLSFVSAREQTLAHAETKRECCCSPLAADSLYIYFCRTPRREQQNKTYSSIWC